MDRIFEFAMMLYDFEGFNECHKYEGYTARVLGGVSKEDIPKLGW